MNHPLRHAGLAAVLFALASAPRARAAEPAAPSASPVTTPAPASVFDYDKTVSLDVHEFSAEERDGAVIHDVTFVGTKVPIKAYIVAPAGDLPGPFAGILYVHWLGEPPLSNRSEFLNEAVALAGQGFVSVLPDAMWSDSQWYENRVPENDYAEAVNQVIVLRRAMDLLLAQPHVDPHRIAYVGHDFGAMYGAVMCAVDHRATTCVFMAGVPHFVDWFLYARQPKDLPSYRAQIAPLDPLNFIAQVAPAPVFFQFASHDKYVPAASAAAFYAAAATRKQCVTYDAGHDLHQPEVAADRVAWLLRTLASK
ncbi:MAG TPA: prolyl oligopeptidase family serine peptidase [Opitutus sp.]|nr:prolyl oligopeptidase family serine peptidase [Opitutus sp.]